jgi:hypothetical protein
MRNDDAMLAADSQRLETDAEIDRCLSGPRCVVGLNGRGMVQLHLPHGSNYIVFSAPQARALADLLRKWADESERKTRGS